MAIYTRIQASDLETMLAPYQIEVLSFSPIAGGNANSNYHIRARSGEYMLTIMEEKSLIEVQKLATLLQWLDDHDFVTTPVIASVTGELVTRYREKPILVKKWIVGSVQINLSGHNLRQIGWSMAQLHRVPAPDYLSQLPPYGHELIATVIGKGIDTKYEDWLKERLQTLERHLPDNLPRGLVHGDIFFDNVLFEENKIKAIIDFEEVCHYYLIFDLGMGVLGLCRTDDKIDLAKARELIMGYQQIRPLDPLEKESLQLFIEYSAVATSCWRFWKYNISSPNPDLASKHLEMVRVAEDVEKMAKDYFLRFVFE